MHVGASHDNRKTWVRSGFGVSIFWTSPLRGCWACRDEDGEYSDVGLLCTFGRRTSLGDPLSERLMLRIVIQLYKKAVIPLGRKKSFYHTPKKFRPSPDRNCGSQIGCSGPFRCLCEEPGVMVTDCGNSWRLHRPPFAPSPRDMI